jgi:hypothetical protein
MSSCRICSKKNNAMATIWCGHVFCTSCLVAFVCAHSSQKCPICFVPILNDITPSSVTGSQSPKRDESSKLFTGAPHTTTIRTMAPHKPITTQKDLRSKITPYEKALLIQKTIKKDFNDNKGKYIKLNGDDYLIEEYRKNADAVKEDPSKFFQGIYQVFDPVTGKFATDDTSDPIRVFIPKFFWFDTKLPKSVDKDVDVKVKNPRPIPRDPGEGASKYQSSLYLKKIIMADFNDKKGKYVNLDGSDFILSDYHKLADKKNLHLYVKGDMLTFPAEEGEDEGTSHTVFIPTFITYEPTTPSISDEISPSVQPEVPAPIEIQATGGSL